MSWVGGVERDVVLRDASLTSQLWRALPDLRVDAIARKVIQAKVGRGDAGGQVLLHARLLAPQESRHGRGVGVDVLLLREVEAWMKFHEIAVAGPPRL